MKEAYFVSEKLVLCGAFLEHYQYKSPYLKGMPRLASQRVFVKPLKPQLLLLEANVKRSRTKIRRLVNCNEDLVKFITLTFRYESVDLGESNIIFMNFVKRVKRKFPDFKYLCVPEFQRDKDFYGRVKPNGGSVHYHLLSNLPYIDSKSLEVMWGQGFIKIKKINNIDNVGAYICKYLGKENFDKRFFRKQKFFYSLNLLKPLIIDKLKEVKSYLEFFSFDTMVHKFKAIFDTKYFGEVEYNQYKVIIECIDY